MPGFEPGIQMSGGGAKAPFVKRWPLANNFTGNDTAKPRASSGTSTNLGELRAGDWTVLTSSADWNSNISGVTPYVQRKLTYDDVITNTLGGGLLGIVMESAITDANGRISGTPNYGLSTNPVPAQLASPSARWMQNPVSLRNEMINYMAVVNNGFYGRISPIYTAAAMGPNLDGLLAGFGLLTGLNPPAAPAVANSGAGTLPPGAYWVVVTYTNAVGETTQSVATQVTTTGTQNIVVTAPLGNGATDPQKNIATNYKVYIGTIGGTNAGPFYLQGAATALSGNFTQSTPLSVTTANPPTANTTGLPGVTTYYIDPGATTKCFRILKLDASDLRYNQTNSATNIIPGCRALVTVLSTYMQQDPSRTSSTVYTT